MDYTLTENSGANISVIWFLEQLVLMASGLRYSWEFKEIICVDNNKAKNNFITPYEIVFGLVVVNTNDLFEFSTVYKDFF